jgi:hypothetical protein
MNTGRPARWVDIYGANRVFSKIRPSGIYCFMALSSLTLIIEDENIRT